MPTPLCMCRICGWNRAAGRVIQDPPPPPNQVVVRDVSHPLDLGPGWGSFGEHILFVDEIFATVVNRPDMPPMPRGWYVT